MIPRPDITVAQVILLMLTQEGLLSFQEMRQHADARLLGGQRTENSFYTALSRLQRRKHIIRNGHQYELTEAGQYAALKAYIRKELTALEKSECRSPNAEVRSSQSIAWDGKWRIVFFDVPEKKRPIRDYLRNVLQRFGFYEFQRSMWIYPHKPPKFFQRVMEDPFFRPFVRMITTSDIDYDDDLRKRFRLS